MNHNINVGTQEVTFVNSYDTAGKVTSITYPGNNKTYSYEYDVAGNLLYLKENPLGVPGTHLADYSDYTAFGKPMLKTFPKTGGGAVKTKYEYYPDTGRLKKLVTDGITITNNNLSNLTHSYTYDPLNRLSTAQGAGTNSYNQGYTYDRIGNISTKSDVQNGNLYNYTYNNKPHAVRSVGGISLDYDANGNMIQKVDSGVTTIVQWSYDNKPTSITKGGAVTTLTYDGNTQRVRKVSPSSGTVLYFGTLYETRGGAWTIHLFAGSQRVASVTQDGYTQMYHPDHLGSTWMVTDLSGATKEKDEYFPFGTYRPPPETFDYDASFPKVYYTFTGQEDDDDLGLYNFGARLYDPVLGKFISADSLVPDPQNPQSLNRYSYCNNNPLIYIDPSGNFDIETGLIEWGDTLTSVTDQLNAYYGTYLTIPQVASGNNITDPNLIYAGDYITLPYQNITASLDYQGRLLITDNTYQFSTYRFSVLGPSTLIYPPNTNKASIDFNCLDKTLDQLVNNANQTDMGFTRIWNESIGGNLDFKTYLNQGTLYKVGNVLYNANEAGNFVWSYFLQSHGWGYLFQGLIVQGASLYYYQRFDEAWDTTARHTGLEYYKSRNPTEYYERFRIAPSPFGETK